MRAVVVLLLLLGVAGCPGSLQTDALEGGDDSNGNGSGSGAGALPVECHVASDCVAAGPKCCDCPTHAVPESDPTQAACAAVDCQPMQCGSPLEATCSATGRCELVCSPVACDPSVSCAYGFETDSNGCLTCTCAPANGASCSLDTDCARVRDDCCGCALGGMDTAVPQGEVAAHDAALGCSANPACPGFDTCAPDLEPRCVQGECSLVAGVIPVNACGRADLAACATGESCTVNANDQATMYGVGVCQLP